MDAALADELDRDGLGARIEPAGPPVLLAARRPIAAQGDEGADSSAEQDEGPEERPVPLGAKRWAIGRADEALHQGRAKAPLAGPEGTLLGLEPAMDALVNRPKDVVQAERLGLLLVGRPEDVPQLAERREPPGDGAPSHGARGRQLVDEDVRQLDLAPDAALRHLDDEDVDAEPRILAPKLGHRRRAAEEIVQHHLAELAVKPGELDPLATGGRPGLAPEPGRGRRSDAPRSRV